MIDYVGWGTMLVLL